MKPAADSEEKVQRVIMKILTEWRVNELAAEGLLGIDGATWQAWLRGEMGSAMSEGTRLRVSCLLRIYGSIRALIPEREQAKSWLHVPNTAALFCGQTPFESMVGGQLNTLMSIANYLDAQLGMDFF